MLAPGGFRLVPGASGVARLADLDPMRRRELLVQLSALETVADVILIDTGAGISANVLAFAEAAHTALIVTTPEPTALTDGYGMIKSLLTGTGQSRVEVAVNMVADAEEGRQVFARLDRVSRAFLGRPLQFAGDVATQVVPLLMAAAVTLVLAGWARAEFAGGSGPLAAALWVGSPLTMINAAGTRLRSPRASGG